LESYYGCEKSGTGPQLLQKIIVLSREEGTRGFYPDLVRVVIVQQEMKTMGGQARGTKKGNKGFNIRNQGAKMNWAMKIEVM